MNDNGKSRQVILQPVAMEIPGYFIYSPDTWQKQIVISREDFLHYLADYGQAMQYNPLPNPTANNIIAAAELVTGYLYAVGSVAARFVVVPPKGETVAEAE